MRERGGREQFGARSPSWSGEPRRWRDRGRAGELGGRETRSAGLGYGGWRDEEDRYDDRFERGDADYESDYYRSGEHAGLGYGEALPWRERGGWERPGERDDERTRRPAGDYGRDDDWRSEPSRGRGSYDRAAYGAYLGGHGPHGAYGRGQGYGEARRWGRAESGEYGSGFGRTGGYAGGTDSRSGWIGERRPRSGYGDAEYGESGSRHLERGASFRGRGPQGYRRSDERIREEICDCLTDDESIDATQIDVKVQGGDVTLTGHVDSRDEKRMAEDLAESISGVRDVRNELRVQRGEGASGTREKNATATAGAETRSKTAGA